MTLPPWIVPVLRLVKPAYDHTIGKRLGKQRRLAGKLRKSIARLNDCQLAYEIDGHLAHFLRLLRLNPVLFERLSIAVFYERWIQPREEGIRLLATARSRGRGRNRGSAIDSGYWTQALITAMREDLNRIDP